MIGMSYEIGHGQKPRSTEKSQPTISIGLSTLAVSSSSERNFFWLIPVKSCLVMAKAKHLVGFIDAPVYPGTIPAVA